MAMQNDIVSGRYSKLLKKKDKHLKVFRKTRDELVSTNQEFQEEISHSQSQIQALEDQIQREREGISFLQGQTENTGKTIEKINDLLGE